MGANKSGEEDWRWEVKEDPLGVGVGNCRGTGDGSGEKSVFSKLDLQRVDVYCKEN